MLAKESVFLIVKLFYLTFTRRILEFDSELTKSSSNSLSSRVRVSQYSTQAACELNQALLFCSSS